MGVRDEHAIGSLGWLLCQLPEAGHIYVKACTLTNLVVQVFGYLDWPQAHRVPGVAGAAKLRR